MQRRTYLVAAIVVILVVGTSAGYYFANVSVSNASSLPQVQIVAAENFWGSLISQIGGTHTHVLSIVSDPNADPHEYESNSVDAQAIANAKLVIVNGAGYDTWALSLIAASNSPNQRVLNVQKLVGQQASGVNPHFWYSPYYVNETVKEMYSDLVAVDPANAAYYQQQYNTLKAAIHAYNARIAEIKQQFAGTRVASTESIFLYLAKATGLDLISPPEFMNAISEGNPPTIASRILFQQQLQVLGAPGNASALVYNEQTITPLTESMKVLATQRSIPTTAVTETIQPPDVSFQDWMNAELISLQDALNLGK